MSTEYTRRCNRIDQRTRDAHALIMGWQRGAHEERALILKQLLRSIRRVAAVASIGMEAALRAQSSGRVPRPDVEFHTATAGAAMDIIEHIAREKTP